MYSKILSFVCSYCLFWICILHIWYVPCYCFHILLVVRSSIFLSNTFAFIILQVHSIPHEQGDLYKDNNFLAVAPSSTASSQPSSNPSSAPTELEKWCKCQDSKLKIALKNRKFRSCDWVADPDIKERKCSKLKIRKHCPVACDSCDEFKFVDSPVEFLVSNGKTKTCNFVKRKPDKIRRRCRRLNAWNTCRESCKFCQVWF